MPNHHDFAVANPPPVDLGHHGRDRGAALPFGISRLSERGNAAQFRQFVLLLACAADLKSNPRCGIDGIFNQHRHRHGPHSARYRRDPAGDFFDFIKYDVTGDLSTG